MKERAHQYLQNDEIVVFMAPLLYEAGLARFCDQVWVISSSEASQIKRLKKRNDFVKNKKYDLIALGRAAVDLNANELYTTLEETETFTKYVGGSPANVAIGMARLNKNTGFIGRVADDQFGNYVLQYFENEGIDISNMPVDSSGAKTGLTFTEIKSPTESSILMYRNEAVDLKLCTDDINEDYIKNSKALLS